MANEKIEIEGIDQSVLEGRELEETRQQLKVSHCLPDFAWFCRSFSSAICFMRLSDVPIGQPLCIAQYF
jgi:hypothetical protein